MSAPIEPTLPPDTGPLLRRESLLQDIEISPILPLQEPPSGVNAAGWPVVPGYEILEVLGKGGMGIVYKARQVQLKRLVALKMIRDGALAGPEDVTRFRIEAEAVARLQHSHIVQIYEIGEYHGLPFFSLEFAEGGNLASKLNATPLPPRAAAQVVANLAIAMHAAHQRGIVHRDLKPGNVLLAPSEPGQGVQLGNSPGESSFFQLKVTDFGLAKRLDEPAGPTASGATMGTPSYMAPEQIQAKEGAIGPATDVYALGAILYELLTGRPPFKAATAMETILLVLSEDPLPPTKLQPKLPSDVETICLKCLQKESKKRYASALDLSADLRRWLAGEAIKARPVGSWERGFKWAKRHTAKAALLVIACLMLVSTFVGGLCYIAYLRAANQIAKDRLYRSLVEDARALRLAKGTGYREKAWELLYEAL